MRPPGAWRRAEVILMQIIVGIAIGVFFFAVGALIVGRG
jgi:hypothetical protein